MSEDILARVREEFQPKTVKEAVIVLAVEMRETRADVKEIKKLQTAQNGKVNRNGNRLTRLEVLIGAAPLVAAIITKASGTWPWY